MTSSLDHTTQASHSLALTPIVPAGCVSGNATTINLDGSRLLVERSLGRVYQLNESAQRLWDWYAAGLDKPGLVRRLVADYELPPSQAANDVTACLTAWQEAGLLHAAATPAISPRTIDSPLTLAENEHALWVGIAKRTICFVSEDANLLQALSPLLAHIETTAREHCDVEIRLSQADNGFLVRAKGTSTTLTTLDAALAQCMHELTRAAYCQPEVSMALHAGAVGHGQQAIIFPGSSGRGKTTLVAGLQALGFTYLCDDVCPLLEDGRLLPVPTCQAVKSGSWEPLATLRPELDALPARERRGQTVRQLSPLAHTPVAWSTHWPVAALVLPSYKPQHEPGITRLSSLEAFSHLLEAGALADGEPQQLADWVATTPAWEMSYDTFHSAADMLRKLLTNDDRKLSALG